MSILVAFFFGGETFIMFGPCFNVLYLYLFQTLFFFGAFYLGKSSKIWLVNTCTFVWDPCFHHPRASERFIRDEKTNNWPVVVSNIFLFTPTWLKPPTRRPNRDIGKKMGKNETDFLSCTARVTGCYRCYPTGNPIWRVGKNPCSPCLCKAKLHRRPNEDCEPIHSIRKKSAFQINHDMKGGYFNALKQQIIPVCSFLLMFFFSLWLWADGCWWFITFIGADAWYSNLLTSPRQHNPWRINFERCFPIKDVANLLLVGSPQP